MLSAAAEGASKMPRKVSNFWHFHKVQYSKYFIIYLFTGYLTALSAAQTTGYGRQTHSSLRRTTVMLLTFHLNMYYV